MKPPISSDNIVPETSAASSTGAYRSGVAARLAGVPVETLRVWERRYGVSAPQRSARGQRLYSDDDVRRLALIKQLVDQGHPIGAVAGLPVQRLMALVAPHATEAGMPRPIKVAVVGEVLARQMAAGSRASLGLDVVRSCARLDGADQVMHKVSVDVLLIEVPELDDAVLPLIGNARNATNARATVVLYRFCVSATIAQLRKQGCLVARAPADTEEISLLCDAALAAAPRAAAARPGLTTAPRRLDDQALATFASAANRVGCECPRHLADVLLMVGSFERYSGQCASRNPADAALHQALHEAAAQARTLLESAMERLARAEGLPLPAMFD